VTWVKIAKSRWRLYHWGRTAGFAVRARASVWDGYVTTGKKWPYGERLVATGKLPATRRAVSEHVRKERSG
jgi:hypothetical protein